MLNSRLSKRLGISRQVLVNFCERWQVSELAFFGSILRDDFRAESDVDILVTFTPAGDAKRNLFDLIQMQRELEQLFERKVDLTEKPALKNPFLRREILQNCQLFYVNS